MSTETERKTKTVGVAITRQITETAYLTLVVPAAADRNAVRAWVEENVELYELDYEEDECLYELDCEEDTAYGKAKYHLELENGVLVEA